MGSHARLREVLIAAAYALLLAVGVWTVLWPELDDDRDPSATADSNAADAGLAD